MNPVLFLSEAILFLPCVPPLLQPYTTIWLYTCVLNWTFRGVKVNITV